jgi:DNA transposition AAA+ family ATPase
VSEQHSPTSDRETNNIPISGDTVKQALATMVKAGDLEVEHEQLIWWFYCHSMENGFNLAQAGAQIGKDSSTVYRVWTGKYGAKLTNICTDIARYRKIAEGRASRVDIGFVETSTWRVIDRVCTAALISQTVAFIWGDSQIGKTTCLEEHARRNNHGQTKYVRLPASAGVQLVMKEIAAACYVSPDSCFEKLRYRVMNTIDDKTLLIIDEMHQVFSSYQHGSAIKVLEVLREIYDRTHCGLVLVATNIGRDALEKGPLRHLLEQLRRRGTIKIQLRAAPPKTDLDKIARAFNLPPAEGQALEIIHDMIHTSGLGMYIKFLNSASTLAKNEGKKLNWDHFVNAHDIIARLSIKEG